MPTLPATAMRRYGQRSASATPRLSCFVPAMSTRNDDTPRLTRFAALHSIEAAREATPRLTQFAPFSYDLSTTSRDGGGIALGTPRLTQFMPVTRPAFSPRSDA